MVENGEAASRIYEQLDGEGQIRLLKISQELTEGRIDCQLVTADLRSCQYVVLSYRWGTAPVTHEILLNGHTFNVRPNLWEFLDVIRKQEGVALWIDALCINQTDLNERNAQVGIMGDIFRSAGMVVNWLGPRREDSKIAEAFELMKRMWSASDMHVSNEADQYSQLESEDEIWQSVVELCSLPYWDRVWVVQEVLLASNNYLLYGEAALPWHMFANFMNLLDVRFPCPPHYSRHIRDSKARSYALTKPYTSVPQELTWRVGSALRHDYGKWWNIDEYNLFRILTMFGERDCTDPLDHVYALLSLTYEGKYFPIRYGISTFDLFFATFHACHHREDIEEPEKEDFVPRSQRAFFRNARFLAEIMQLLPVYHTKTQPYFPGVTFSVKGPSPRPDPCFPAAHQVLHLQCTLIDPQNEPPVLRSNTLKRSMSAIAFDAIVHVNESSTWLLLQKTNFSATWHTAAAVTIKDSQYGRGFKILASRTMQRNLSMIVSDDTEGPKFDLVVPPEGHSELLQLSILATQPS